MEKNNLTNQVIKLDYNYQKLRSDLNSLEKDNNDNYLNMNEMVKQKIKINNDEIKQVSNELKLSIDKHQEKTKEDLSKIEEKINKNLLSLENKIDNKMDKFNFDLDFEKVFGASLLLQLLLIK